MFIKSYKFVIEKSDDVSCTSALFFIFDENIEILSKISEYWDRVEEQFFEVSGSVYVCFTKDFWKHDRAL